MYTSKKIMKYHLFAFLFCLLPFFTVTGVEKKAAADYLHYHKQAVAAESLIAEEQFEAALGIYESVFGAYDFVFLREYQIATQLALSLQEKEKAIRYLKAGIAAGWELKAIRNNEYLAPLHDGPEWEDIAESYPGLRAQYEARLDQQARNMARKMFNKDQRMALGALLRLGDKARERYAERKFAPHSEMQMKALIGMLQGHGYPGEQLIGNDFWMSTIISHHNSISQRYAERDTLYAFLRPKLIQSIKDGQMSPYEFALVDDWQKAVASGRTEPGYGFLNPPDSSTLSTTNALRKMIGLRTIELRNQLIEVEKRTGMHFYLPDWVEGKIPIGRE